MRSRKPSQTVLCRYNWPAFLATPGMRRWDWSCPAGPACATAAFLPPCMMQGNLQLLWQQGLPKGLPGRHCLAAAAVLDDPQGQGTALLAVAGAAALQQAAAAALQGVRPRGPPGLGRLLAAPGAPGCAPASAAWHAASCSWAWTLQHDMSGDCLSVADGC